MPPRLLAKHFFCLMHLTSMKPPNDAIRFCCSVDSTFEIAAPVLAEYMQIRWGFLLGPTRMF